jgi:hypothetical protein
VGRFEYLAGQRPRQRREPPWLRPKAPIPAHVLAAEWAPAPLSRLGRRLWSDIELYLEFVAIARERPGSESRPR